MNRSAQLALEISRPHRVMGEMNLHRALVLSLVALSNTAMWGLIIHFGSRLLGIPIRPVWLGVALLGIFGLLLLTIGMVALASDVDKADGFY